MSVKCTAELTVECQTRLTFFHATWGELNITFVTVSEFCCLRQTWLDCYYTYVEKIDAH